MHPAHFQALRVLASQLGPQVQALHASIVQLHQTIAAIGQQMPMTPQQQVTQQQMAGQSAHLSDPEDQQLGLAMQQAMAGMAGMPHMPQPRQGQGGTRGFPNGTGLPPFQGQMSPQPQQQGNPFQSPAGGMLDGLDIGGLLSGFNGLGG